MKNLILLTTILTHSFAVFAQVNTTTEAAQNQQLLKNADISNQNWQTTNGNQPPTSIKIFGNGSSSTNTTSSANLSDQDKQLSENYVDQGAANRIIKKNCVEDFEGCTGNAIDHKVGGVLDANMLKAVSQAYATFGSMGDFMSLSKMVGKTDANGNPLTQDGKPAAKDANGKPTDQGKEKKKTDDYCKYIPTASETVAAFAQKNTVDGLNQGGETSQKESLLKAAKSHKGRADQAQIQAVGWYAGGACYAYLFASGKAVMDTSLIVKLGATVLLGTFYQREVAHNKEFAEKIENVAKALPNRGDCNPVTQNDCYCAEPENENDPKYCKAQIAQKAAAAAAFTRVACTDSNMKLDPSCNCEKSNSCFDKFLENNGLAELQIGMGYGNSPFKSIASLAHGKLEASTLSSQAYAGTAAIAKKALNDMSAKLPENNTSLTLAQKAIADAIASKGIPANIARLMAQNSPPQSDVNNSMAKFNGFGGSSQVASYSPKGKNNVLDFSSGDGLGTSGKRTDKKGNPADEFLSKLGQKTGSTNPNSKVLEFAQKAQASVPQITKSDKPIFEIISIRYQTFARRLLDLDPHN